MSDIDTSAEAVKNLAEWHAKDAEHYVTQNALHLASFAKDAAATLLALLAERDRLREALRIIAAASPDCVGSGPRATEYDRHRRIAKAALGEDRA